MNDKRPREIEVDMLKGMGILLVILGHINTIPPILYQWIFSFHMPLFFVIAGYFFKSTSDLKGTIVKDAKRLLLPYVITIFILVLYSFIVHGIIKNDLANTRQILCSFIYPTGSNTGVNVSSLPIWFLCSMFWCKLVVTSTKRYMKNQDISIMLLLLIGFSSMYLNNYKQYAIPLGISQGITAIVFFEVGTFLKSKLKLMSIWVIVLCTIIWSIGFGFSFLDMMYGKYNNPLLNIFVAICSIVSLYGLCKLLKSFKLLMKFKLVSYLSWLGKSSLAILCVHTIERYLPLWSLVNIPSILILFIAKVILCSLLVLVCYRIKVTRFIFGLN